MIVTTTIQIARDGVDLEVGVGGIWSKPDECEILTAIVSDSAEGFQAGSSIDLTWEEEQSALEGLHADADQTRREYLRDVAL